jgi:hypothetical protein
MSSSKRTKHIKFKYFFITDKIEQGEIIVEYKPTGEMWCDVSTKPKEGTPFKKDRAMHQNCLLDWPDEVAMTLQPAGVHPTKPAEVLCNQTPSIPNISAKTDNRVKFCLQECVGDEAAHSHKNPLTWKSYVSPSRSGTSLDERNNSELRVCSLSNNNRTYHRLQ